MARLELGLFTAAALLIPFDAGASPPLGAFPATLEPGSGTAPSNTRFWAFGTDAPPLRDIGFAVSLDGVPVSVQVEAMGCCVVVATRTATTSGAAYAVVSSAGIDLSVNFLIGGAVDTTPPVLTSAAVLDTGLQLIIGTDGNDDLALAGFLARVGTEVRGAAPPRYVLKARPDPEGCVSVTALDLAGNESAPQRVCGQRVDGGVHDDAGASDAGVADGGGGSAGGGCSVAPGASPLAVLIGMGWMIRRRRSGR